MPHASPEARRAYLRDYKRRNRDQLREGRAMSDRARNANRRARELGAPGTLTIADVRLVMAAARCAYCGTTEQLGIDHVIALANGGPNTVSNLACCCHPCNASKWLTEQPGRWARDHEHCTECSTTERAHLANGLCTRCHRRDRARRERESA